MHVRTDVFAFCVFFGIIESFLIRCRGGVKSGHIFLYKTSPVCIPKYTFSQAQAFQVLATHVCDSTSFSICVGWKQLKPRACCWK